MAAKSHAVKLILLLFLTISNAQDFYPDYLESNTADYGESLEANNSINISTTTTTSEPQYDVETFDFVNPQVSETSTDFSKTDSLEGEASTTVTVADVVEQVTDDPKEGDRSSASEETIGNESAVSEASESLFADDEPLFPEDDLVLESSTVPPEATSFEKSESSETEFYPTEMSTDVTDEQATEPSVETFPVEVDFSSVEKQVDDESSESATPESIEVVTSSPQMSESTLSDSTEAQSTINFSTTSDIEDEKTTTEMPEAPTVESILSEDLLELVVNSKAESTPSSTTQLSSTSTEI